jgi:hypothetical protein
VHLFTHLQVYILLKNYKEIYYSHTFADKFLHKSDMDILIHKISQYILSHILKEKSVNYKIS